MKKDYGVGTWYVRLEEAGTELEVEVSGVMTEYGAMVAAKDQHPYAEVVGARLKKESKHATA